MYVRVFHDLWESSLMAEAVPVRWLFITMLGMADKGRSAIIDVPLFILARQAGMTEEETRTALVALMSPDPASRSEKEDGRRVVALRPEQPERGWEIVNWEDYSKQFRAADRRRQVREAVARHREKKAEVSTVNNANPQLIKKHEGEEGKGSNKEGGAGGEDFVTFWAAYPKKAKKPPALKAWTRLSEADRAAALEGLKTFRFSTDEQFIPLPASWINARRWEDEIPAPKPSPMLVGSSGGSAPSWMDYPPGSAERAAAQKPRP